MKQEVLVGDLTMMGIPDKKRPNNPLFDGDMEQLRGRIQLIIQASPARIFYGHDGAFAPEVVRRKFNI